MRATLGYLLLALCALAMAEEPRLLVTKTVMNEVMVEGQEMTVSYAIHNVGEAAAANVLVNDDEGFPGEQFEHLVGLKSITLDHLAAGESAHHNVIYKPLFGGAYNFTGAQVTYTNADDEDSSYVGVSSKPRQNYVLSFAEYNKDYAQHLTEWAIFGVASLVLVFVPYFMYKQSASQYDAIKAKRS